MISMDMSNEDYHAHKAISSSAVKMVHLKSLLHWKKNVYKENTAFDLGTAVHAHLLEPENKLVVCGPDNRRGNAWTKAKEKADEEGKTLLVRQDFETSIAMVESVMQNELAVDILQDPCGIAEMSVFNKDPNTGLQLKVRPDLFIAERGIVLDVKTTRDASPKAGGFERQFFSLGYHIQAAFYKYVLELEGYLVEDFAFLAVEKEAPYAVQMHYLHHEVIEFGMLQVRDTLEQIKDVEGKDINFTGWPSRNLILLPKWMKATERMDEMSDYTITNVEALWPRINKPYKFDNTERRSVPCDPFDDGAEYTMQFRMSSAQAKELFKQMVTSYREAKEDSWPNTFSMPFKKDEEDGTFLGKAKLKAAYGKEQTRLPAQYDSQGNKLPSDFRLTTGSTVNIAVAFAPYHMRDAGVSLRLRSVQVINYEPEKEAASPFGVVADGYVHTTDAERDGFTIDKAQTSEPAKITPLKVTKPKAKAKKESDGMDDILENWE